MYTMLMERGAAALNTQGATPLRVEGFELGTRVVTGDELRGWDNNAEPALATMQGTVVHRGDDVDMFATVVNANEVILNCVVPESATEVHIANAVLLVSLNGAVVPFTYSATPHDFIRFATTGSSPGIRYYFNLILRIPECTTRFDFSTLPTRAPEFLTVDSELDLPQAATSDHDQFLVQSHSRDGGAVFVINSQNKLYGCPFVYALEPGDTTAFAVTGGTVGDGYRR